MPRSDKAARPPITRPTTAVSLFAGIGGFDLALERSGVKTVAAVEIDRFCRGLLAHRFPDTRPFHDVREVSADDLLGCGFDPADGIITAGWPCQDLSVAGHREGLDGARSGLFFELLRLARDLRPRWLVLENVPGLLSSNGGRDMGTVIAALEDLGYGLAWRVLDAQFIGVPQRRRRVLFVAGRGDGAGPVEVLLEPESSGRDPAPRGQTQPHDPRTPAQCPATCRRTGGSGADAVYCSASCRRLTVARTLDTKNDPARGRGSSVVVSALTSTMAGAGGGVDDNTAQAGHLIIEASPPVTHTLRAEGADASEDGTGRGTPLITTGTTVRRLTPRECERLQGFPDDWTLHRIDPRNDQIIKQSDSARYRQLGNAVAVPVAEWVISRLIANAAFAISQWIAVRP